MKYQIAKDKAKRLTVKKYEIKRSALKFAIRNEESSKHLRWHNVLKLNKLPRNGSKVRVNNRCVITGRAKGVHRDFKVSRVVLRDLASMGLVNGVTKSSW